MDVLLAQGSLVEAERALARCKQEAQGGSTELQDQCDQPPPAGPAAPLPPPPPPGKRGGRAASAQAEPAQASGPEEGDPESLNQAALTQYRAGDLEGAVRSSRAALALRHRAPYLITLGAALYEQRDYQASVGAFEDALRIEPHNTIARFNLANVLTEVHMYGASIREFRRVLQIQPSMVEAQVNMLRNQEVICDWDGRHERMAQIERIIRLRLAPAASGSGRSAKDTLREHRHQIGVAGKGGGDAGEEAQSHSRAAGNQEEQASPVRPWHALAYPLDLALLRSIAESVARHTRRSSLRAAGLPESSQDLPSFDHHVRLAAAAGRRVRVGLVSYCMSAHPSGLLLAGLFRWLRESRVEALCVPLNAHDGSPQRTEIESDCERLLPAAGWTPTQVSAAINQEQVQVAINLDGWTSMGRTNDVFALSPAPIQVQYLGFPGTLGADYVPFLLTDALVSPPELRAAYSEHLLYLPRSYYVNDYARSHRDQPSAAHISQLHQAVRTAGAPGGLLRERRGPGQVGPGRQLRASWGLPNDGPLLCNLNNLYKLSPDVFALWLRVRPSISSLNSRFIQPSREALAGSWTFALTLAWWAQVLGGVSNSSMVILQLPEEAPPHLVRHASAAGLANLSRLAFVPMVDKGQHLRRAAACAVFLDTLLVNAHTVAMDVLWAGVPLVTVADQRFSSRVGAAVLRAAGCLHSIARSSLDYVLLAMRLASSTHAASKARACLLRSRGESGADGGLSPPTQGASRALAALWDTAGWAKDLEQMVLALWEVQHATLVALQSKEPRRRTKQRASRFHLIPFARH